MARLTVFLYNMIVLVLFIRSVPSQSTTTSILPSSSPTAVAKSNSTVQPSPTATANTYTTATPENGTSTTPSPSPVAPTAVSSSPLPTTGKPADKKFEATIRLNETFKPAYQNLSSNESQIFIAKFEKNASSVLSKRLSDFKEVDVTRLSKGSVVVDFDIVVKKSSNASERNIETALEDNLGTLGYHLIGDVAVKEVQQLSTVIAPSTTATGGVFSSPASLPTTPTPTSTSSTKGTEIWDKAIDLASPLGTFIIVIVAVVLIIILLIALICVCCKYRKLKKKTHFPDHMTINDADWIRSNDDLLMWERNLRASEVKPTNGVTNRPINEKRT